MEKDEQPQRRKRFCCRRFFCGRTLRWIFTAFIVLQLNGLISCEISQDDDYTLAYVNLTYVDPLTKKTATSKEEIGKFSQGKVGDAAGVLLHWRHRNGSVNYGCEKTTFEKGFIPKESWIALIRRGVCSYARKIANAAQNNATAVVIYDDRDGTPQKMPNPGAGYKMVAIFIPQDDGERMAELVDNGTRVYMYITVGTHQSVRYTNINRTSVLFVSISFIVLMIISLAWLIFYYVQRFRYINAKDQLARRLCSAAKKALSKIPLKTIKDTDAETECCAVCIEPYKVSDVVRILPCKHQFHKSCIDPWLLDQRTCPMCKMDILKFYGLVFAGSEESILQIDTDEGALRVNLEPESDALPSSRSSHLSSQAVCGAAPGPPVNAAANQRSHHHCHQEGANASGKQAAADHASSEATGHQQQTFQPNTAIDCIKITMLENSPMATRMMNKNKLAEENCSSQVSEAALSKRHFETLLPKSSGSKEQLRETDEPPAEILQEASDEAKESKDGGSCDEEAETEAKVWPQCECAPSSNSHNNNNDDVNNSSNNNSVSGSNNSTEDNSTT